MFSGAAYIHMFSGAAYIQHVWTLQFHCINVKLPFLIMRKLYVEIFKNAIIFLYKTCLVVRAYIHNVYGTFF